MSFNDVAIVFFKGNDYRLHFCYMIMYFWGSNFGNIFFEGEILIYT